MRCPFMPRGSAEVEMVDGSRFRRFSGHAFCVAVPTRGHGVKSSRPTALPKHIQTTCDAVTALRYLILHGLRPLPLAHRRGPFRMELSAAGSWRDHLL
jgi:hypothetical protein